LPIIALTANAVHGAKEMFLANGFSDFISKPIEIQKLNVMLSKWLPPNKINNIDVFEEYNKDTEMEVDTSKALDFVSAVDMISEINTKIALSRVSGIEDIYRDSLILFTKKVISECDQMFRFIRHENIDNFAIRIHAMKSMLSTIGAMGLSERAALLELAAKNKDLNYCVKHFPAYQAELLELQKRLAEVFSDEEKTRQRITGNSDLLNENIPKILAAADDLDNETCVKIVDLLLGYDFGDPVNAELEKAMEAVNYYNYNKTAEILRGINYL
jgi:HPt (histidine-containing phosphotransfer) domain-containing protein